MQGETLRVQSGTQAAVTGLLSCLLFIAFVDNFVQLPIMAPLARSLGAGATLSGLIVGMYSVTNLWGGVVAGVVLDRWGRRLPLAVGLLWAGLGVLLYGYVSTPVALLWARAFHGLGGSILVPAVFTIAADTLPQEGRARGIGRIGATIGLAAIFGPAYGGMVSSMWGLNALFGSVFVLMAAASLLTLTRLPETIPQEAGSAGDRPGFPPLRGRLLIASGAGFFNAASLGAVTLLFPLQMEAAGHPSSQTGLLISFFSLVAVITMFVGGKRRGAGRINILSGLVAIAAGLSMLALGVSLPAAAVGMAVFGLGFGMVYPVANTWVAESVEPKQRGRAFGVFYAFYSLAMIVAPVMAGALQQRVGTAAVYLLFAAAVLTFAAFLKAAAPLDEADQRGR